MKAGAIGAITASAMTDHLVSALYGKKVSELTTDEKRLVSSLVTIIDLGRPIGTDKFNNHQPTSVMTVLTYKHGNLIIATPGRIK